MAVANSSMPEAPHEKVEDHVEKVPDINMLLARNVATEEKDKEIEIGEGLGRRSDIDVEKEAGAAISRRESSALTISASPPGEGSQQPQDPNVVFWEGRDDPANPMNWSPAKKWGSIMVVSGITFLSPLGSSMIAPGVPSIMSEFHFDNELLSGFVVSVYVLGFAFGPLCTYFLYIHLQLIKLTLLK